MNYKLRCDIRKLLQVMKGMHESQAMCPCGRIYRLNFDAPEKNLIALIEAELDNPSDDPQRGELLEVD